MHPTEGFTLIELLVVIAIIAVLAVVVVLTLNPAELLRQSRDSNRLSDLATMSNAINLYNTDQGSSPAYSLGTSNTVYVSIPDPTATTTAGDQCQGLNLITLPATYTYHCAASSTYRNVNGTGWIPVNLASTTTGSPLGALPIDPTNNTSSHLYYSYETNGSQYEMTSVMESQKYGPGGSNDVVSNDGGTLANTYTKGTNLAIEPLNYGGAGKILLVQSSTLNIDGTSSTCALSPTKSGDLLLVMYRVNFQSISGITFSDPNGDPFIKSATSSSNNVGVAYVYNASAGNSSIMMSGFASTVISMSCFEYSGVQISSDPFDGGGYLANTATTTYQSGAITTTGSSDLLVGQLGPNTISITPGTPFVQIVSNTYGMHGWNTYTVQALNKPAGVYNNMGTLPSSGTPDVNIVAFKVLK